MDMHALTVADLSVRLAVRAHHDYNDDGLCGFHNIDHFMAHKV